MDLYQNPFHIISAIPRDNRKRIMELADERCLVLDSGACTEARATLTNPRKRLSAEIAWLPGVGPKRATELLSRIESSPKDLLRVCTSGRINFAFFSSEKSIKTDHPSTNKLSPIARANLLAAGLSRISGQNSDGIAEWILELSEAFEDIEPEELCVLINEERVVSGFPEVSDLESIESEIQDRRRYYRQVIKLALDNLPAKELVKAVTVAVESATNGGEEHGPILIADLVDSYEVEAQGFLGKEEENIKVLVGRLRTAVDEDRSDAILAPMVNQLIQVVTNWDNVAQPIQVSAKSRGLTHEASLRIAHKVRDLAVHMFNEHSKLDFSQQLTNMLQEAFAEVGEVAERAAEDADVLGEISERRKLSHLLDPISDLCKTALEYSKKHPSHADKVAHKVMIAAPQLVENLSSLNADILSQGKDQIAITLTHCAVVYGNTTKKWKPCIDFLETAFNYANSQEIKSRIQDTLRMTRHNVMIFVDLEPITSAPSLSTINGIGMSLYGSTDLDSTSGSYLATYYFVFFFLPIFPICRYRVIQSGNGYSFLGKAPLRAFDKWHIAISFGLIGLIFVNM